MTLDINQNKINFYQEGIKAKELKNFTRAVECFTKAIELKVNYKDIYIQRSYCLSQLEQYDEAIQDLNIALADNPEDYLLYYNRGLNHLKIRNFQKAKDDFSKSISLNPNYAAAFYNRGLIFLHKGEYDNAISDFSKVIRLDNFHYRAFYKRGVSYEKLGYILKALDDINVSLKINPDYTLALETRAKLLVETGDPEAALSDLIKISKLNPNNRTIQEKQKLIQEKVENLIHDSEIEDISRQFHLSGLAKISIHNFKGAIEDYDQAIKIDPKNSNSYYYRSLAKIALSRNDYKYLKAAHEDLNKALELNPTDTKTMYFKTITEKTLHRMKSFQVPSLCKSYDWISLCGASESALELGGDYFYIYDEENPNQIAFTIGDIEGKGARSIVFLSLALQFLDQARKETKVPSLIFKKLNDELIKRTGGRLKDRKKKNKPPYITSIYGIIERKPDGTCLLEAVNAGHLSPIQIRNHEILKFPDNQQNKKNLPLNVDVIENFHPINILLHKGDKLIFFSDGLIEENAGTEEKQFGLKRLEHWVSQNSNLPIQNMIENLIRDVKEFGAINGQEDDITVLGISLNEK